MNNIKKFVDYIENIYQLINIYRGIIIVNNKKDEILLLEEELKNKNHNPKIIKNNDDINYNYRLFIISDITLLNNFNKDNYNFIAIY